MDTSDIPTGEIAVKNINVEPIDNAIQERADALAEQMNPKAAAQFVSDMRSLKCTVKGKKRSVTFSLAPADSYLLKYLKKHNVPVAGGDNGTAYDVDGTPYHSLVDPDLWGTQLPWLELPHLDGEEEARQLLTIMAPDCATDALRKSSAEIAQAAIPEITEELMNTLGGGSK